jgi:hypothetical protein
MASHIRGGSLGRLTQERFELGKGVLEPGLSPLQDVGAVLFGRARGLFERGPVSIEKAPEPS